MNENKSIFDLLEEHAGSGDLPMHMPGHKRDRSLLRGLSAFDITEIGGFDDLHKPEGVIADAERRAARVWGSESAHILVNGSTCGILAAFYALCRRGDSVIAARNCHKSVFHAIELLDLDAHYVMPETHESGLFCGGISAELAERALADCAASGKTPSLMIITSPTYEGVISDVRGICAVCRKYGVPLVVDSAHGAHLGVLPGFPESAVSAGADITVVSLHKTLSSLTQTALILCGEEYDERIRHALDIFESSSPSYLLIASADECVRTVEKYAGITAERWLSALSDCKKALRGLKNLELIGTDEPSKLIISTARTNVTGGELARILENEGNVTLEAALPRYVIAMTGAGDNADSLARFASAVLCADQKQQITAEPYHDRRAIHGVSFPVLAPPEKVMPIYEALRAPHERVPLDRASGRVCAEYVTPYPPGVPITAPGERVTPGVAALIPAYFPDKSDVLCVKQP